MLREDHIRLMTDLAMFAEENRVPIREAGERYESDYVGRYLIRGFFGYTAGWLLFLLLVVLYRLDTYLGGMNLEKLEGMFIRAVIFYAVGLVVYEVLAAACALRRYRKAAKTVEIYRTKLMYLKSCYEYRSRREELMREGMR